jgi:hypothetical protein
VSVTNNISIENTTQTSAWRFNITDIMNRFATILNINSWISGNVSSVNTLTDSKINGNVTALGVSIVNNITLENTTMKGYVDAQIAGVSGGNASFNASWVGLNYIPYTGANQNIDLNNKNVSSADYINNVSFGNITVSGNDVIWTIRI